MYICRRPSYEENDRGGLQSLALVGASLEFIELYIPEAEDAPAGQVDGNEKHIERK